VANPPLDTLTRRIARLRVQVARTLRDAGDAKERAREVTQTTSSSRRRRWARRYEQAFERNAKELEDLNL
jgi:hypothetical protein